MATLEHISNITPASDTATVVLQASATHDHFVAVMCTNKGLGEDKVTVFSKALNDTEANILYAAYEMVVPGRSTVETKKWALDQDHSLYVKYLFVQIGPQF